ACQRRSLVNWCAHCETVLANEQVVDGRCWRCDGPVVDRELEQWFFRITAYAEELLRDLDRLTGWPERVLTMQRNWIGRSPGAEIRFPLEGRAGAVAVFTTRADTLFGVTFMSLAAEHPLVPELVAGTPAAQEVAAFSARVRATSRAERALGKEGVATGAFCRHPVTGARLPIYVANFVLMEYGTGAVMAVPAHDQRDFEFARAYGLPVRVPEDVALTGTGGSPLAAHAAFVRAACPRCGGAARRETDTMDTFVESSWYFARYCSPRNDAAPFDPAELDYWLGAEGVERYIGGIEHAVLHLLYARFFTKVLRDLGFLRLDEPFRDLLTQGMVIKDGAKMSKSKGNVVDPDYLVERYGADTARLFCLFQAPPEKDLDWSDQGVEGMQRFLHRLWRLVHALAPRLAASGTPLPAPLSADDRELHRRTHETIRRVSDDVVERLHFNTAVAAVMDLVNALGDASGQTSPAVLREAIDATLLLLAPFVPHVASELWEAADHARSLDAERWPAADPGALARELIELPVQVNGKLRGRITVPADADEAQAVAAALADPHIRAHVAGRPVRKVVFVPGRMLNLIV